MKMSLLKASSLIAFLSVSLSVNAQNNDYVITVKGDTLPCKITTSILLPIVKYQTAGMTKSQQIKRSEIKEYYLSKKKLLYRLVLTHENHPLYMLVIEKGKINLYALIDDQYYMNPSNHITDANWYINKGTDSAKVIKYGGVYLFSAKEKRKNNFAEMIMDNKDVYEKYLADDKSTLKELRQLVHLYNTGELLDNMH